MATRKSRRLPSRAKSVRRSRNVSGYGRYYVPVGRTLVRGQGRYSIPRDFFSAPKVGSALGGASGAAIGTMIAPGIGTKAGQALGSWLGDKAGKAFKSITGWGEYAVRENSLLFPDRVVPSFGEDSIRVRKREYIASIDSSVSFANNLFPINPGLSDTFPWLSSIANNFEQYRFNGLIFQFVSTSSDAIASTTNLGLGQVIAATDYNSVDHAYLNAPQMLGSMFSNSGKPSENIMHAVECAPSDQAQKLYYVRSGDVPTGADIRLYDMASFQLATQNMPAVYTGMGQLWVTYDVTFCKSVQNNQLGFNLNTDQYDIVAPYDSTGYFGTSRTLLAHSNLGTTVTSNKISFPPTISSGYYMITYLAYGTSTALVTPTLTYANCTDLFFLNNQTASGFANTGSTFTGLIIVKLIRITARDATITLSGGTLPTLGTYGNLVITQVNGEIYGDL